VDVCLNKAVNEPKSGAYFPAGQQTISGAQALSFVRQRYGLPNGDLDRIVRQQVFLGALAARCSPRHADQPVEGPRSDPPRAEVVVLSKGWELSTFAAQMAGLSAGAIELLHHPHPGRRQDRRGGT